MTRNITKKWKRFKMNAFWKMVPLSLLGLLYLINGFKVVYSDELELLITVAVIAIGVVAIYHAFHRVYDDFFYAYGGNEQPAKIESQDDEEQVHTTLDMDVEEGTRWKFDLPLPSGHVLRGLDRDQLVNEICDMKANRGQGDAAYWQIIYEKYARTDSKIAMHVSNQLRVCNPEKRKAKSTNPNPSPTLTFS